MPPDRDDFAILFQVAVKETGRPGHEVFGFMVCSPQALLKTPSGKFIRATLVVGEFSWETIRTTVEKMLLQCRSCSTWQQTIDKLRGYLDHADS